MTAQTTDTGLDAVRREIARACREAPRDPAGGDAGGGVEDIRRRRDRAGDRGRADACSARTACRRPKAKWPALRAQHAGLELHMIGPLQSNKAQGGGGAVRRHPFGRPAEPVRGAGQGDRQAGPAAAAVRRDQHRRRGAEGRRAAAGRRCVPRALPRRLRARDRRADVHPAGRRGAGAAFRADRQDRRAQRPASCCRWA